MEKEEYEITNNAMIDSHIGTVMYVKGSSWCEALDTMIPEDEGVVEWLLRRGIEEELAKSIGKEYYEAKKDEYFL